jgi:UDP-N-acetylmuramate dehydrogenase
MKDTVASVDVYHPEKDERKTVPSKECGFGYRDSAFKRERVLILGTTLELALAPDPIASRARMEDVMRLRKEKQPLDGSSCGCVFKNVDYANEAEIETLTSQFEIPGTMRAAKRLSAGWLIQQAGLLGQKIGDVEISGKHGNFFLNRGKAKAEDVVSLISLVKRKVRDDFGIELHDEVQYLGF